MRSVVCGEEDRLKRRAVVAISEDLRTLVHLSADAFWRIRHLDGWGDSLQSESLEDTGQSADEVLAAFLEGRGAG